MTVSSYCWIIIADVLLSSVIHYQINRRFIIEDACVHFLCGFITQANHICILNMDMSGISCYFLGLSLHRIFVAGGFIVLIIYPQVYKKDCIAISR